MRRPFRSALASAVRVSAVAALLAAAAPAEAADLGVRGQTWPVAEPDLLAGIEARLSAMEASGELARLEAEARARVQARLEEPDPVPGIAPARERRSRLFDPAIVVERDMRSPDGTLIAAAGTRIDPLAGMTLGRDLLFIDGRRETEVAWALAHEDPAKIVLLAGRPLALARAHGRDGARGGPPLRRPFFFDQGGRLAARFALTATPSLVEQAGSKLRITEIPLADEPDRGADAGAAP